MKLIIPEGAATDAGRKDGDEFAIDGSKTVGKMPFFLKAAAHLVGVCTEIRS